MRRERWWCEEEEEVRRGGGEGCEERRKDWGEMRENEQGREEGKGIGDIQGGWNTHTHTQREYMGSVKSNIARRSLVCVTESNIM